MIHEELFELCKEVHKRTKWDEEKFYYEEDLGEEYIVKVYVNAKPSNEMQWNHRYCPLYTSDYLLDKLPKYILWQGANSRLELVPQGYQYGGSAELWCATYAQPLHSIPILEVADTPLKALLKLTIALHEAGELK